MPNPVNVLFFSIGILRMIQIHPNRYGIDKKFTNDLLLRERNYEGTKGVTRSRKLKDR